MLNIQSKEKSMYDYAEDYYKIKEYIEKEEHKNLTMEESLLIFAVLDIINEEG